MRIARSPLAHQTANGVMESSKCQKAIASVERREVCSRMLTWKKWWASHCTSDAAENLPRGQPLLSGR